MSMSNMANQTESEDLDIEEVEHTKLPPGFFPESWSDNPRCDVLFAPFRAKSINPVNYDSKMQFWKTLILKYCEFKGSSTVSESELRCAFRRQNKKPHCLSLVLHEMLEAKQVQMIDEFLIVPADTWTDWAVTQVKRPMHWGWNKVAERVWTGSLSKPSEYVVVEAAKKHSEKLLNSVPTNKVISMDEFTDIVSGEGLNSMGIKCALHYLKVRKQAQQASVDLSGQSQILLKFSPTIGRCAITDTDREVYTMKWQEEKLSQNCEDLEKQIGQHDEVIRKFIRDNKKQLAKTYLKKKHILLKALGEFFE